MKRWSPKDPLAGARLQATRKQVSTATERIPAAYDVLCASTRNVSLSKRAPHYAALSLKNCDRVYKPGSVHEQARAAVIYLRRLLPNGLKAYAFCRHRDSGGNRSGSLRSPEGVASDRVYRKPALPRVSVSSYLAFPPLPPEGGGISLLHFPWGRPRRTLSVILPYEARTFLTVIPFGAIPRDRATR